MKYGYHLFTLGCQMNISDSERIVAVLENLGFKQRNEKGADLLIINACSVRQKPIDRIYGKLRVWQEINPEAKKVLTGCVLQADKKKMKDRFDYCFKIDQLEGFIKWLEKSFEADYHAKKQHFDNYLEMETMHSDKKIALVPIMSGCNNMCSYCSVPTTRGIEWSRDKKAIIEEVKCLIDKGYKKIVLLGQNVCSYHTRNSKCKNQFVDLLRCVAEIEGEFEVSFMSPHPKDFSDDLIELIAGEKKISRELHLPVQSGDDRILGLMNRKYNAEEYLALIEKLRHRIKNITISTDIIVGFPNETDKMFQNTVKLAKSVNFNKAYIAMYSPRQGTLSATKYNDSVPYKIKKKRWRILENLINKKTAK